VTDTGIDNQPALLEARGLSHSYGSFQALAPLDLTLHAGEVAVLEGPNGAGKSTLLLCLSGLLRPAAGEVRVAGWDPMSDEPEVKRRLAFVPDVPRFYFELTVSEHLMFIAAAHDAVEGFEMRAESLLQAYGLWEARDLHPHHLSRGMSLKLGVVFALIRPFDVLLLDEPTSALDATSRRLLLQRVRELKDQGACVVLSTHSTHLTEGLADHTMRLDRGILTVD
jgi:ABC-2 type transport system ATP-binding protein